jgi:hypothetical protein
MILFPFKVKRYKIVESHADHLDYVKLIIESRNIIGATTILMMTKLTLYADNVVITIYQILQILVVVSTISLH